MNIERGFIFANCSAPNSPALPGRPSTCRLTTSASASSASRRRHPAGVAVREPVGGVEEDHPQPQRLGDVGQLGADVAVADDAERAAADLVAALGRLVPDAVVHPPGLLGEPAGQRDDLADHQLHDAAGVGVRRVEDRDAALGRGHQVDLVGADAEAADRHQVARRVQRARGHVGVGADAEQVHAGQGRDQLVLGQGAGPQLDLVAARLEGLDGERVDVLEQEDLHAPRVGSGAAWAKRRASRGTDSVRAAARARCSASGGPRGRRTPGPAQRRSPGDRRELGLLGARGALVYLARLPSARVPKRR